MFENEIVIHKTFGRGKVLALDDLYLKVLFESGEKTLILKMVLEKNLLTFENKDIQEKMVYECIVKPQELLQHQEELKKKEILEKAERVRVDEQRRIEEANKAEYEREKTLELKIKKEKEEENRAKCELLKNLKKFGFEGFLHTTDMNNFKNIIKDGVLKPRKQALDEGSLVTNSAEQDVIDKTTDYVQNSCRFYYYFKTPTNYVATSRGYYRRPVILVFDEDIINLENAWFSSKNAVYSSGHTQSAKTALTFEWDAIFERGSYNNSKYWDNNIPEDEMKSAITAVRNAEFLIKGTVDISYIKKIYFKFEADMEEAKTFCPNDIVEKFVFDRSKFDIC